MLITVILLVVGFVILIKGADIFIDGASVVATHFNISKMIIGLTIVSLGTSAPEFAISCKSIISGNGDIVLGNVIGSNIINILLILGICSIINPLNVKSVTIKREMPMLVMFTCLLAVILCDNMFNNNVQNNLTKTDGILLVIFLLVFIYYLFSITRKKNNKKENLKYSIKKALLLTIIGIVGILIGSDLVVDNAVKIAKYFNISERVISLTIIALGTSLPELASGISAALKKEQDILIGNIIGSNIFNISLVLGLPIVLFGGIIPSGFDNFDVIIFLVSTLLLLLFAIDNKVTKIEGIGMLLLFITYYTFVIIKGVII